MAITLPILAFNILFGMVFSNMRNDDEHGFMLGFLMGAGFSLLVLAFSLITAYYQSLKIKETVASINIGELILMFTIAISTAAGKRRLKKGSKIEKI